MEDLKVGDIIKDRYELVRFLGSGSFGEVWLTRDRMTGHDVALKIYLSLDPAGVDEFQREYSNTIDLSSPYLLTPEYFDVFHRRPFLVMKYCERGSSSKLAGSISEEQLWSFIEDVANGLDVLHGQSDPIVHQDIKPDNILVDINGRFLITDFGISKRLRATMRRQSKRDVISGAMPYMAPERFDSNPKLNTASDIWSLGASIYELATGELPFSGFGGAMQRNGAEMPRLENFSSNINQVMQLCLSPASSERPTAKELSIWAKCKQISSNKVPISNATQLHQNQQQTVREGAKGELQKHTKSNLNWILLIVFVLVIGGFVWFSNQNKSSESQETLLIQQSDTTTTVQPQTPVQQIQSGIVSTINGEKCYFYKGAFYYESVIYPIMVGFIENDSKLIKAVYKNVTYGARIPMSLSASDNSIILTGKDGANDFAITLETAEDDRLVGTAISGSKSMTVRIMPTSETFELSNIRTTSSSNNNDISNIFGAFISKYSDGSAPWSCLNNTSAKRLSNDLEIDNSPGGIFMVPFTAPLTVNGNALVTNQFDTAIDWEIYLRGPNAGVTNLMFSAMPQYVDLKDVASKIAKALKAKYSRRRDSDYGQDCVYLYSIGNLWMAIYCSFGAHGGTIEGILGDFENVSDYANNCM